MRRAEAEFAAELSRVRPDLRARYEAALPGARAAVLGRLWRGLLYEPLPGLTAAGPSRVLLPGGRELTGRERRPYDLGEEPVLWLDGRPRAHPARLLADLGLPGTGRLVSDLDNSVASLALSRAGASPRPAATPEEHEQSVVDGHPYHPGCRNRPGVSVAEQLAYMPEHRPTVALDLLALPLRECLVSGPWPGSLVDGDRLLLPVHPWQTRHVLPALGLRPYATGVVPARPLMSVRTLAPLDGGPHLKTAFTTRMTSGVRDISPGSVRDCVPLSALLTTVAARCGGALRIARYLAGAAGATGGAPSADLSVLLREPTPPGTVLPVAAVTLATARDPAAWLAVFARLALTGTLGMLALGVALEAHGQNLLVVLGPDGLPSRLVYRDLADVRISPARLARNGIEPPPVSARLLDDDPAVLRAKLFGSLVGTTFGSLVAVFGRRERAVESRLWAIVAAAARHTSETLPDTPDVRADRAALLGERLPAKAHLLARLDDAPPGDRWTTLPNPLVDPGPA
ncbi:IucA/IucC family siderophore biosynthesis protein [Nonomuraea sp. MG754425]|uniref:IucA/IucC family C-terminal-domain containing protein n=1 Tax=Nonomuraea sp. MG754425 TaxID=2570319 RepID=UPI001F1F81B0|nr:IucA/IucC family C-terminal-domain containing protein [Nonomuraea sp. MG754425]MCF6471075.1 IucA/IucC family siderophore biosynthesis protein [Nonomuraea sp. MG754425]